MYGKSFEAFRLIFNIENEVKINTSENGTVKQKVQCE
jgi:hypothetical protein